MTENESEMMKAVFAANMALYERMREARQMGILAVPLIELDDNGFISCVAFHLTSKGYREEHGIIKASDCPDERR
jgi:hypothetical protein